LRQAFPFETARVPRPRRHLWRGGAPLRV